MSSSRIGTWGCQVILGDRVSDRAAGLTPLRWPTTRGAILLLLAVAVWLGPTTPHEAVGQDTIPPLQYDTEVRTEPDNARWAVSGFGVLLREGQIIPRPSEVRHPRTAAGLDESGRWLTLFVVDGRRTDYSEGVSERELAELMREFDCHDALNLDGGGSSILLYRDQEAADSLRVMNLPSDLWGPRPIPVMLGIARRK